MRRALLLVAVVAAATYLIAFRLGEGKPGLVAFDVFGYFYPNILHALRSLGAGGSGLLWNPFQNCGQPFFAITESGLLYPLNAFFLITDPDTALRALLFTNLVIGGVGAYALGRELGVSPGGSLGGALSFMLGFSAYYLTTWMPTVQAPYVWMPVALLCCERLVKAPSLRQALLLGIVLALSLLPGHPQFVLFTCELVALRLLWSLFDGSERRHIPGALGGVALALVVMLLLTAVQFFPSLELVGESVRHASLSADEIAPRGNESLAEIGHMIFTHLSLAPFSIVQGVLAAVAIVGARRRRVALFYFVAGALFLTLSFGTDNALGRLYYELPIAKLFRWPMRFRFVTGFCAAILTGPAIDVLVEEGWRGLAAGAAALAVLYLWLGNLQPLDWAFAAALLGGGLLAVALPTARPLGLAAIVATVGLAPVFLPGWTVQHFLANDAPLRTHADLFERLRERLTPQDRIHLALSAERDPGFQEKTAQLFALRAIADYETQITQRYAEYVTMLRNGMLLKEINQIYYPGPWDPVLARWPLIDLAATRFLVVPTSADKAAPADQRLPLSLVDSDDSLRVYENAAALPRAYYVPQIAVVEDPKVRLRRLAAGADDRRLLALVDAAPASGFVGVPGNLISAAARFVVDEPERVVLDTTAPERGFLFLADVYFPGWSATVNGQSVPILAANHAFRLVEVPAGPVTVEFRYRSRWLWIGALVSGSTLLVVAGVLIAGVRQPRRIDPLNPPPLGLY